MAEEIKKEVQETQVAEVKAQTPTKLDTNFEKGIYGSSDNFKMALNMATKLAESTIVPQTFQKNPSNCLVALEQAQRLGMSPLLVMQNLYVIQGKPSWSSSFLIALINASGKFDIELQYEEAEKDGKPYSCLVWTEKDGRRINGMKVTMEMADKEGWTKKSGSKWVTLPALMLRYRAVSFFAKLNCPELTLGLYTEDEIHDNNMGTVEKRRSLNDVAQADIVVESEVVG